MQAVDSDTIIQLYDLALKLWRAAEQDEVLGALIHRLECSIDALRGDA
jgi:hypothetical protein